MLDITLKNLSQEELTIAPSSFKELVRMASIDEALALCEAFGGMDLLIPSQENASQGEAVRIKRAVPRNTLRQDLKDILSERSYASLLRELGGTKFNFPRLDALKRNRRNRIIRQRIDQAIADRSSMEKVINQVVIEFGIHRRHVYRILKRAD